MNQAERRSGWTLELTRFSSAVSASSSDTSGVPYPNIAGKHDHEALVTPSEFLAYLRQHDGLHPGAIPESFVLCYSPRLFEGITSDERATAVAHRNGRFVAINVEATRIGVAGGFGIGAPVAATVMEELAALGVRRFVSIGAAGSLNSQLEVGDVVVCTEAIRDEGVSHHYLAPGRSVTPSALLTSQLTRSLQAAGLAVAEGPTWTIDAPYRETVHELHHYRSEGVLTVEMEAAALFAVANYRKLEVGAAFVISDTLDEVWTPAFHDVHAPLHQLYLEVLALLARS